MSVKIQQLTKIYGQQKAVNELTFSVNKGEILGFLGPNGAGKTTTMKMISCFIPPTSGTATICGYNVQDHPMEVRKHIGYLPEHNPLYLDLYVRESLAFIARLHGLGNTTKARIDEMIEMTGLEREQKKKIGQLSKGYRQRVGLAQAMLHDPEVLILDEPTSGLDPNQLADIRGVIKQLGEEKTVILSTHIMQEVQAMCDRVVIINQGKMVANDTAAELQQRTQGNAMITVEFAESVQVKQLAEIKHVQKVEEVGRHKWQLLTQGEYDIRANVFQFAVQNNLTLLTLQRERSNLEEVFRVLTLDGR